MGISNDEEIYVYAYRSGLIEYQPSSRVSVLPEGTLFVARGPSKAILSALARQLARQPNGLWLVPGCDVQDETAALAAFHQFFDRLQKDLGVHSNVPEMKSSAERRREHIEWVKARARPYVDQGDWVAALSSIQSDLRKNPEFAPEPGWFRTVTEMAASGLLSTPEQVREFIELLS